MAGAAKSKTTKAKRSRDAELTHSFVDKLDYISKPLRYELDEGGKEIAVILPIEEFIKLIDWYSILSSALSSMIEEDWKRPVQGPSNPNFLHDLFQSLKAEGRLPADVQWIDGKPVRTGKVRV